jgi:hypothetical protein
LSYISSPKLLSPYTQVEKAVNERTS